MIPAEANNRLCEFGMRWRLDGDYIRCLGCARAEGKRPSPRVCQVGRPMVASCDGQPFKHADGCKQAQELHPWSELRALLAEPGTALVEDMCARIKAADDAVCDYMLDSDDCISVLRGTWKGPLANDCPAPAREIGVAA